MSDLRERIANKIAAWVTTTYAVETHANDTHALADAVLDALGLEQAGWARPRNDGERDYYPWGLVTRRDPYPGDEWQPAYVVRES